MAELTRRKVEINGMLIKELGVAWEQ